MIEFTVTTGDTLERAQCRYWGERGTLTLLTPVTDRSEILREILYSLIGIGPHIIQTDLFSPGSAIPG
jgi:hypothetical protein